MTYEAEEASADNRQMAKTLRGIFVSLMQEGFTERQALELIGQLMAAGMKGQAGDA